MLAIKDTQNLDILLDSVATIFTGMIYMKRLPKD